MGEQLLSLSKALRFAVKHDWDALVVLTGQCGIGKSTLSIKIAQTVDPNFSMKKNITFSRKETIEKIKTLSKYSCLIVDESINILFRRDFMKREQKQLLKVLDMSRDKNLVIILNIPNFWSLDSHIQHRIRAWVYVVRRGVGIIFEPSDNPFSRDLWNRKLNEILVRKGRWRRSRNYISTLRFNKLKKKEFEKYLKVKAEKKAELEQEPEEVVLTDYRLKNIVDLSSAETIYMLKEKGFIQRGDFTKIADMIGITKQGLRERHVSKTKVKEKIDRLIYNA